MRTYIFVTAAWVCAGLAAVKASSTDGQVVAATGMECSNYFAVKTGDEYALLEWYGGYQPQKGDKVSGEFSRFGYQDLAVRPGGTKFRAYIADYGLSLDDANDKLKEKCN